MTAPVGSVTVPCSVAFRVCANSDEGGEQKTNTNTRNK